MYFYKAYGLDIHTTLPLPELLKKSTVGPEGEKDDNKPDIAERTVLVQFGKLIESPLKEEAIGRHYWREGQDIYLFWPELGTFRVRAGREITIAPAAQVDEARLRPPVLGICMAALLHQRGFLVLHASAAALPGGAVAFLGDKGWGKSTMNATLHKRGHTFITDDILAIDLKPDKPIVYPAFPQMKLWPSAITALGEDPRSLPKLIPQLNKRQRLFEDNFGQQPVPLKALYLLGRGPKLKISPLPTQSILGHLFEHSYSGRCGKALLQHGETAHFLQCMTLAKQTPVYHLKRPSDLSLLPTIAEALENHVNDCVSL